MMQSRPILSLSLNIPAPLAAGLMVTDAGVLAAAGGRVLGCLKEACTVAGQELPVDVMGSTVGTASAAYAVSTLLMVDATGKLLTWTTGNTAVARALEAAVNPGDRTEVLLIVN